jgi:hypothetical protein
MKIGKLRQSFLPHGMFGVEMEVIKIAVRISLHHPLKNSLLWFESKEGDKK